MLRIKKLRANDDRVSDHIPISLGEQAAQPRTAQQSPLRDMANQLGVECVKIPFVELAQPPHLAAADVEHAARSVELSSEIHGLLIASRGFWISVRGVHRRAQ